ncbi:ribonuclease H-like domain-containing protein [Tanacetum coccineum]
MTRNKFYLSDYQDIDGGYVAFAGSPKGGKIIRKGKIKIGKLDFEDVYFVKELKFNLFSVSQMCDKKSSVLFTETECLILSPDFKLLDERGLTCLFAKATIDESNLWHKRLGHVNFKTMNKFVRGNLVRGLPSKIFENDHTCVACQKESSTKPPNTVLITKPHNKTPYELLIGRSQNLDFMRPFGCPVTVLNTLDHLGKFEGKADEGFLVRYSVNRKAFRVFNTRTKKFEENLHIKFLENKPNVTGSGPEWLFNNDSLTKSMNYEPVIVGNQTNDDAAQMMSLLVMLERRMMFSIQQKTVIKNSHEKDVRDQEEALRKQFDQETERLVGQGEATITNSTNRLNTVSPSISATGQSFYNNDLSTDPLMPDLGDSIGIVRGAYDDEDVGAEADLNNLETTMNVSPIPTTRIYKDHPKD